MEIYNMLLEQSFEKNTNDKKNKKTIYTTEILIGTYYNGDNVEDEIKTINLNVYKSNNAISCKVKIIKMLINKERSSFINKEGFGYVAEYDENLNLIWSSDSTIKK
jgi:hypothetical protein